MVGQKGFVESDREDLEQEMLLDLLERLPKYNPNRAKRNTFIACIVDNKIATIIEAREAGLRDYRLCRCSLNERIERNKCGSLERIETLDQEDYMRCIGSHMQPLSKLHDFSIDIREVIEKLPPELHEFCIRLGIETVTEISRDTGIPRGTIYESIKKLRNIFKVSGLKDYVG